MMKKFLTLALSLVIALTVILGNIPRIANADTITEEEKNQLITQNVNDVINDYGIAPYANIQGGGGNSGNLSYYSYGVVVYEHPWNCAGKPGLHHTIYLPSSFINKVNSNVGNWTTPLVIGGVAKLLGLSVTNPVAIAIGTALASQWAIITWKDNGNGVTLAFDGGILPYKIASGCNYYLH